MYGDLLQAPFWSKSDSRAINNVIKKGEHALFSFGKLLIPCASLEAWPTQKPLIKINWREGDLVGALF